MGPIGALANDGQDGLPSPETHHPQTPGRGAVMVALRGRLSTWVMHIVHGTAQSGYYKSRHKRLPFPRLTA